MILVDPRAGSAYSGKVEFLPLLHSHAVPAELHPLEYGDFAWFGNGPAGPGTMPMCVERKAVRDMLACIRDGRFSAHQLPGLVAQYDVTWLLVEGTYRCGDSGILEEWKGQGNWVPLKLGGNARTPFMFRELDNFLDSVAVMSRGRIVVAQTSNKNATARFIADRFKHWTSKAWDEHKSVSGLQSFPDKPESMGVEFTPPSLMRKFGAIFDGVGWDKSRGVEGHFGSIRQAVDAGVKEWQKVPGIGKVLAKRIVEAINENRD